MPAFLEPTAPTAADALLPADPAAALLLAQDLLEAPRMSNHSHGLWGYHGETEGGRGLTIQSTGIGGPSAAIVLRELRDLGVERAVRIGACTPLDAELRPGQVIVVERALVADGTSVALGAEGSVTADRTLTKRLIEAAPGARAATVASTDLFYGSRPAHPAPATDLESAALLALGDALGLAVAGILVVGDPQPGGGGGEAEHVAGPDKGAIRLGRIASAALGAQDPSPGSGTESRA
jgi:uridine phosphorylase